MPPRFVYWTIIFGGQPTSFRAATRDELLPTFKRIQALHPDAQLRYFARGKLWYSEDEARAALIRDRFEKRERARPPFRDRKPKPEGWKPPGEAWKPEAGGRKPEAAGRDHRGRDWRPGGEHQDPRERFKVPRDVKRARFKARLAFRRPEGDDTRRDAPHGKPGGEWKPKPGGWKPRPAGGWKPKPGGQRSDGGGWRPKGDARKPRPDGWTPKAGGWRPKPGGQRPEGSGPKRPGGWKPRKPFKKKDEE
jgi:23S rRNA pseudouridine2605 synthase